MPGRTRQKLSTSLTLGLLTASAILGSFNPANASRSSPVIRASEQRAPFFAALPWENVPDSPRLVRRLAENSHPLATQRLLEAADASHDSPNFLLQLALVEALHGRTQGTQRDEVVRRLLRFFRESDARAAPGARATRMSVNSAATRRVRASAALALAHSLHREALATLLGMATADHSVHSDGKDLAIAALSAVPAARNALLQFGFEEARVERSLRRQETRIDLKISSPLQLAALANEPLKWAFALSKLGSKDKLPHAFLDPEAWTKSLVASPIWSLRALTCLSAHAAPQLQKLALKTAKKHQNAHDTQLRLAALWAISVIDPGRLSLSLASADDETLAVLLRQGLHGTRATEVALFAYSHPERPAILRASALSISLFARDTWSHFSDRQLWALDQDPLVTKEWIAPLAFRTLPEKGAVTAAEMQQLAHWLSSDSPPVRSAAIRGLSYSDSTSALGLLLKAYRRELDARVRRTICQSLASHRASLSKLILQISELDPDPGCRALVLSQPDVKGAGFFVGWTQEDHLWAMDRYARQVPLVPTADGFVGIVDSSF